MLKKDMYRLLLNRYIRNQQMGRSLLPKIFKESITEQNIVNLLTLNKMQT